MLARRIGELHKWTIRLVVAFISRTARSVENIEGLPHPARSLFRICFCVWLSSSISHASLVDLCDIFREPSVAKNMVVSDGFVRISALLVSSSAG